jgi:hypothetical protein
MMRISDNRQLERTTTIDAPVGVVYQLFMDNQALSSWAPMVDAVVHEDGGHESGVGRTRTCAVTMNGRSGTMVEQCVEAALNARASYVLIDDSFGFSRMLRDYGFTVHFGAAGPQESSVRMETFYSPANLLADVLNRLMMRRKFRAVVDALLDGLRTSAEQRHRQVA